MNRITTGVIVSLLILAAALGWTTSHYHGNAVKYKDQRDTVTHNLKMANETISDMQTRQRDVAALDAKYTKELADAKAENGDLQRKLNNGGRVLVKGHRPVPATTETSSPSGVGYDATIELSDVAGRNVLGIRSGIKQDQTALRALQDYIKTQCLK
ncbi:lysis protein [Salmonella enterica subsp. enterica serovar Saintpaul]|uniref:Lysis protein n=2 Tax=Salmonella enterica TaxID=28901 RepID=A0A726QEG7_SALET|nr:lysis protein [Salmonella enterica]EAT8638663.1 lysis protein [Salmonella enterica subsp. enterica serovar Cerro]EAW1128182.1 lysis protein [Salmonella enterica subsp. enterica]EAY3163003.1 lysis protein [Salmonella enterica subsp. enterica serovar Typhimurium]EBD0034447.1 lysis protein [Salmonella enterica subsp. enterica serovar Poona]EBS0096887.1 lysis protein [Salmonella enterica subsp. enterica serovar Nottingham]EBS4816830.1 lysis protein [Salmonella enterica subsp. enterica serovar 